MLQQSWPSAFCRNSGSSLKGAGQCATCYREDTSSMSNFVDLSRRSGRSFVPPLLSLAIFLLQMALILSGSAAPTYSEAQAALRSGDLSSMQRDGGVTGDTAAMLILTAAYDGDQAALEKILAAGVPVDAAPAGGDLAGQTAL